MYTTIIIFIVLIAVLLVLAVLVQNSKGGGLANQFGGANSSQLLGVKRTGDLLEQVTWGLAITMMVLVLLTSFVVPKPGDEEINSVNIDNAQQKTTLPTRPGQTAPKPAIPATPAPATPTPAPATK